MSSLEGHIHIGVLAGWIPLSLITLRLAEFQKRYPRVRVALTTADMSSIESELISERLTFAVTADTTSNRAANEFLTSEAWGDMDFVAATTPAYMLRDGPFERSESLLLADVVDVGEGHPLLSRWAQGGDVGLQAVLAQLQPSMSVPDYDTALSVISSGHGWGFVPRQIALKALGKGQLVEIPVKPSAPSLALALTYRRMRTRSLADSVFLEFWLEDKPGTAEIDVRARK
jgi:DNA-binding transcriptional LysR family regulator